MDKKKKMRMKLGMGFADTGTYKKANMSKTDAMDMELDEAKKKMDSGSKKIELKSGSYGDNELQDAKKTLEKTKRYRKALQEMMRK